MHARLLEVKTLVGTSSYASAGATGGRAVDTRARRVPGDYVASLARKDMQWCGTAEGEVGPLQGLLQSYGRLQALVFGAVGEASADVETLITTIAHVGAAAGVGAREFGARSRLAAIGQLAWATRRLFGMQHWRDIAQLMLDRKSRLIRTRDGYMDTEDEPRRHTGGRGAEGAYYAHQRSMAAAAATAAANGGPFDR